MLTVTGDHTNTHTHNRIPSDFEKNIFKQLKLGVIYLKFIKRKKNQPN